MRCSPVLAVTIRQLKKFHSMSISYRLRLVVFLLLLLPLTAVASTPPVPAHPPGYVVDLAGVLDVTGKDQLDDLLRGLEQQTTAQMVILTIHSLDGKDIDSFSLETAEQWKIGQKGSDNGLLFVVAMQDRKYRFEIGYGLESVLPDSLVGSIGRQVLVPYFKQSQYDQGITAATGAILKVLSSHYGVTITGVDQLPGMATKNKNNAFSFLVLFFFLLIFILFVYSRSVNKKMRKNQRYRSGGPGMGPIIFPGGGWGGGSSGGFGGFSGGGGGFGGGGASGSW